MSLPVSQYEALLAEVRGLRRKAQRVQQLATPLISNCSSSVTKPFFSTPTQQYDQVTPEFNMEPIFTGRHNGNAAHCEVGTSSADGDTTCSEDECGGARSSTHMSVSSEPIFHQDRGVSMLYHGTWPVETTTMWNSEPTPSLCTAPVHNIHMQEVTSVMSFASSSGGAPLLGSPNLSRRSSQQLEAKVDMVYSLLAMLSSQEHADMGETLLALSTNPESCLAMRQSGCIPLLVQMVQSDREAETRKKASLALHNLVHSQPDEKLRKREVRIFKLLEQTRAYTDALRNNREFVVEDASSSSDDGDRHPVQTVAHLMKLSFDELHRQAICQFGGIHSIANLVEAEHVTHGSTADEAHCILMRRYACMALTNLTFGDSGNKALLCSFREFMRALVVQLQSPSDELRQVTASVLRNLSWRADSSSKDILHEVGSVSGLMISAMLDNKENTLKSILSALWNLSAHCTENKSEICSIEGALGFLIDMLTYKTPSKSLAIIENSGGILRNVSSQIAVRDDYRAVLRAHNCLQILLDQLKSPSLTIVSNACGTLWNLSAKCALDQELLWQLGAPSMLRSLNHSKHKMIAMGSSAALKNLLSARPNQTVLPSMDSTALALDLPVLPTLGVRKQKALLQELDQTLSETYENIEKESPVKSTSRDDFSQKTHKNRVNRMGTEDFTSLNEPSTSYDTKNCASLPYIERFTTGIPLRSKHDDKKFVKSVAKSCLSSADNRLSKESAMDEEPHCSANSSLTSSIDNDKHNKHEMKLKEISACSDEKDHCSIEDISDADQSIGFVHKVVLEDSSGYLSSGNAMRKEADILDISNVTLSFSGFEIKPGNSTTINQSIDEVDMEDISIQLKNSKEDDGEKRDVEKEQHVNYVSSEEILNARLSSRSNETVPSSSLQRNTKSQTNVVSSGIPLPRSLPRQIPTSRYNISRIQSSDLLQTEITTTIDNSDTSVKKANKSHGSRLASGLPRLSLPSSTPIRLNAGVADGDSNVRKRDNTMETSKVQNIDRERESTASNPLCFTSVEESSAISWLSTNIQSSPSLSGLSDSPVPTAEKVNLNISLENNSSAFEKDLAPQVAMGDRCSKGQRDPPSEPEFSGQYNCDFLGPEACVSFSLKDDRDRLLERSCEDSNPLDNRMRDPDAMIESLDRFTAELVSQASHLQKDDDKHKDYTWNEDSSPNELTFPSISGSAPNVITFNSTEAHDEVVEPVPGQPQSADFSSLNTSTMTQSTLIAIEASKMATAFHHEAEMSHSSTSVASLELDKMEPPSLVNSSDFLTFDAAKTPKLSTRKISLPRSLMVRRALSNSLNNGLSLESVTNLDMVNPPSMLEDVFDMDGSVTSVASLPTDNHSEARTDFVINGAVSRNNPMLAFSNGHTQISDIENVNPPSLFNEVTDLCNSLADIATEAMGSETEAFEDCCTHVPQTEDDVTEFSDANSVTPVQSDLGSSPEASPRKHKTLSKQMTNKQKRNLARDRYKTYTVAAELVLKGEQNSTSDDFKTTECFSEYHSALEPDTNHVSAAKLTPKEKRQMDRSRFETQTIEVVPDILKSTEASPPAPVRSKLSIRRNFMQKRLENRDRFKTQTLIESSFSSSSPPSADSDLIHALLEKEANIVLKSIRDTKAQDDLLDCETLSLVSNDDDSEQNSAASLNYRTYHKSWGMQNNIPVIAPQEETPVELEEPKPAKPKIVKPSERVEQSIEVEDPGKGIRGRRKGLYSRAPISNRIAPKTLRPIRNMTSNLVKNVTSSLRAVKPVVVSAKPPVSTSRASSGYGSKPSTPRGPAKAPVERQGTFTKDEPKSRIPMVGSKIQVKATKIPAKPRVISTSADRGIRNVRVNYGRSTSADSRDSVVNKKIQSSPSSQSLKGVNGAVKKSGIPHPAQRSGSNGNLNGPSPKKQVTSKIANIWKRIEESKNKPQVKDSRVWIQGPAGTDKQELVLRKKTQETDSGKRVSRLGSFIVMDEGEGASTAD